MHNTYVIGLSGGSGSGKTTLLRRLIEDLDSTSVSFITMDDYYYPREQQFTDDNGVKNFDLLESINADRLASDIQKLKKGETLEFEEYTFNNEKAHAQIKQVSPAKVIIIEGLFVLHYPQLTDYLDYRIFVKAREATMLIRRIKRDQIERNYPLEDVLYRYQHHVLPSFDKYIAPYESNADIVFDTEYDQEAKYQNLMDLIQAKSS